MKHYETGKEEKDNILTIYFPRMRTCKKEITVLEKTNKHTINKDDVDGINSDGKK